MAEFVRFVYPKISTVDVSSQTVSRIYSQPKVLFVYPISSTGTNIRPISTNSVNQQVDNIIGTPNVIFVTMETPNLQQIQLFPVVSRQGDVHIHRDPNTGQLYQMTDSIHQSITRLTSISGVSSYSNAQTDNVLSSFPESIKRAVTRIQVAPYNPIQLVSLNDVSEYYI